MQCDPHVCDPCVSLEHCISMYTLSPPCILSPSALSLYGLLSSSLFLSPLSHSISLLLSSSLYHFLFNAFTRWLPGFRRSGTSQYFSYLGECSRFPFGLSCFVGSTCIALCICFWVLFVCYLDLTLSTGTLAFGPNLRVQPLRF